MNLQPPDHEQSPADAGSVTVPWQRTLWTCCIAQLFSISAFSAVMPLMPFYIRDLGVEGEAQVTLWAGLAMAAGGLTLTIFSPIWGTLSDRFGRKIMLGRAMFGGAAVLFVMGLARNVYQFVALRALQGCLTGTMVAATTLVASVVPKQQLARSLSFVQTAMLTGTFLGPWMGGFIADRFGYRAPFHISGALLFVGGVLVVFGVRESFARPTERSGKRRGLRKSFGVMGLAALLGVFFFISFSRTFVYPIFPLFVEQIAVGYKPAGITGMAMGLMGLAAGISAIVVGRLSDRFGHRRLLIITTLMGGILSVPQALVRTLPQLLGLWIAKGFAAGGTAPAMSALIGGMVPAESYGRAYGFSHSAGSLGVAVGPLAGAVLSTHLGLRWPFAVMGLLLMCCSALVYLFIKPGMGAQGSAAASVPTRPTTEQDCGKTSV